MRSRKSRDLLWFHVHSWIGLKLSVLMSFVLFTGTMAVFSQEIDWLLTPEMRARPIAGSNVAFGAAYDAMRAEYPEAMVYTLWRHRDPWFALEAVAETPWGHMGRLWFDPGTGAYQGVSSWRNVQRFFRSVHRHLMLPLKIGIPIVTVLAFPLLLSLVAGLCIYKGFWRGFFSWPRFSRRARIWAGDLHRLAGLWSIWFLVLIVITSIWYFVEVLGGRAPPFPAPKEKTSLALQGSENSPAAPRITGEQLDTWIALAHEVYPGLEVRRIDLPRKPSDPVSIMGDLDAWLVRPRANAVVIDPATGQLIGAYRGEQLGLHSRIAEAADPLHFGYFGGLWTKALWFVMGLLMTGLSVTGCVIYGKRVAGGAQARRVRAAADGTAVAAVMP